MKEVWKDVTYEDYGDYYQISNLGRVRSKDRYVAVNNKGDTRFIRGKIMKLTINKSYRDGVDKGYVVVNLRKEGRNKVIVVHRLVALAFIDNDNPAKTFVNHIDGNKHNNHVDNLEWVTTSENNQHAIDTHLREPRGVGVIQYDLKGNFIASYKSVTEASRVTGISRGMISHNVNGRCKHCGEFVFVKK